MAKHQTKTRSGTLAHIRIRGQLYRKHFRAGTSPTVIEHRLTATRLRYRTARVYRTGRFEDDARAYLASVKAMPTYDERQRHIEDWIACFGLRDRYTITADEIRAQLHRWRTEPRLIRGRQRPLSASAVNNRRTALMHLYSVLDGKAGRNPVKDVPKFREPDPRAVSLTLATVRALFRALPASRSKARLLVLAYTGIPHAQIKTLTAEDVQGDLVRVAGRQKGAGTPPRIVPLSADGRAAFTLMRRMDAWGTFSNSSLRKALQRACTAIGLEPALTPYDLRHFFASQVYRTSGDLGATQTLLGHSTPTLTRRYTVAAVDDRLKAAVRGFRGRR